jgi:hypothetical protein
MLEYPVVSVSDRCAAAIGPVARGVYNASRPHKALNDQTPTEFASNYTARDGVEEVKTANELAL